MGSGSQAGRSLQFRCGWHCHRSFVSGLYRVRRIHSGSPNCIFWMADFWCSGSTMSGTRWAYAHPAIYLINVQLPNLDTPAVFLYFIRSPSLIRFPSSEWFGFLGLELAILKRIPVVPQTV